MVHHFKEKTETFLPKTEILLIQNKRKLANDGLQFCLENLCGKKSLQEIRINTYKKVW